MHETKGSIVLEGEESLHSFTSSTIDEVFNDTQTQDPSQRPTIHISASQQPTCYHNLARKYLRRNSHVLFVATEAAILVSIDTAMLLERNEIAQIERYVRVCHGFFLLQ